MVLITLGYEKDGKCSALIGIDDQSECMRRKNRGTTCTLDSGSLHYWSAGRLVLGAGAPVLVKRNGNHLFAVSFLTAFKNERNLICNYQSNQIHLIPGKT